MPWGLAPVLIRGPSMVPTLRDGDAVLVRSGGRPPRPGDIVLARFRSRPDLLVVKRLVRGDGSGWWLRGDNEFVADDSRAYGVADIEARVVLRYWPRPRLLHRCAAPPPTSPPSSPPSSPSSSPPPSKPSSLPPSSAE